MASPPSHIALVGPMLPYRGGIAEFGEHLAAALKSRGHRVSPFTFSRQYPDFLFPGKTQYETDAAAPVGTERTLNSLNPISWYRTARMIEKRRPDAVLFQFWLPFFGPGFGKIARKLKKAGISSYAVVHNAIPHEKRLGDKTLAQYFFRSCHGAISLSRSVTDDLATLAPRLEVVQGVHPMYDFGASLPKAEARALLDLPAEGPLFLFFGFIRPYKGLDVLLNAWPAVREAKPDAQLVVAGECYGSFTPYQKLVDKLELAGSVHFHQHFIPKKEVTRYFSAADLVVQPYKSATQSGVAQVAYHFEKPMVVTDVGGLSEIVPHERAGMVVPPNNSGALSQALVDALEPRRYARLEAGVKREKPRFEWKAFVDVVDSLTRIK